MRVNHSVRGLVVEFNLNEEISNKNNVWIFLKISRGKKQLRSGSKYITDSVKRDIRELGLSMASHYYNIAEGYWNKVELGVMTVRVRRLNGK